MIRQHHPERQNMAGLDRIGPSGNTRQDQTTSDLAAKWYRTPLDKTKRRNETKCHRAAKQNGGNHDYSETERLGKAV